MKRAKFVLRDVSEKDIPGIIALNEHAMPAVNRIGAHGLRWFAKKAAYFRVAVAQQEVLGFMIGLDCDTPYRSPNYLWFKKFVPKTLYVDRIVVSEGARRRGVATAFYDDIELLASDMYLPRVGCEVNTIPPNEESLAFHRAIGFRDAGTQEYHGGKKAVAFLVKDVPRAAAACA